MSYAVAQIEGVPVLAVLNQQLIENGKDRNPLILLELEAHMRVWLQHDYRAVLFEQAGTIVGYASFEPEADHVCLRQFFVARDCRRSDVDREAAGFRPYCITMEHESRET